MVYNKLALKRIIRTALEEDLGLGDLTSVVFSPQNHSSGRFTAKADGVLAGVDVITETYFQLDETIQVTPLKQDGDTIHSGETIAEVDGNTPTLLSGERTVLNLLQHLSGIATLTRQAVEALNDHDIRICDTRKTLPGLRMLQKYAVRCGGGYNHRYRLDDSAMIKDNHIKAAGSITEAVKRLREKVGLTVKIEVETESRDQVEEAVRAGADIIMLDNRSPKEVTELLTRIPNHIITEVSGGITLDTIGDYRNTGIDYISLGFLTHSVTALDISFNLK